MEALKTAYPIIDNVANRNSEDARLPGYRSEVSLKPVEVAAFSVQMGIALQE